MKKFLCVIILNLSIFSSGNSAKVSCSDGECEFINSVHYLWANTNCYETIFDKEVRTNVSNFIIIDTDRECQVFESK